MSVASDGVDSLMCGLHVGGMEILFFTDSQRTVGCLLCAQHSEDEQQNWTQSSRGGKNKGKGPTSMCEIATVCAIKERDMVLLGMCTGRPLLVWVGVVG